jgi:hypothetical protein
MLGKVTVTAFGGISPISLCTVPRIQVLVFVQRAAKSTPIIPILLICIDDIRFIVTTKVEAEEVFFSEPERNIKLGSYTSSLVSLIRAYKAHGVETRHISRPVARLPIDKRLEDRLIDE